MEIGRPTAEHVTLGLRPRVTCSTSGRHILHIPLTHVRHLLIDSNVATEVKPVRLVGNNQVR